MKKLAILFVLVLFVFFTTAAFSGSADLSGTWVGSTEVDGMEVEQSQRGLERGEGTR